MNIYDTWNGHQPLTTDSYWDEYSTSKIFVLCANKISFDTFVALTNYKKAEFEKFVFVEKTVDLGERSDLPTNKIIILEDFAQNPNCREILDRINGCKILL